MKYTHFTLEEREVVESLLNEKKNFKEIARVIGKSPSGVATVHRESTSCVAAAVCATVIVRSMNQQFAADT